MDSVINLFRARENSKQEKIMSINILSHQETSLEETQARLNVCVKVLNQRPLNIKANS